MLFFNSYLIEEAKKKNDEVEDDVDYNALVAFSEGSNMHRLSVNK
jgi:hypothetical protein